MVPPRRCPLRHLDTSPETTGTGVNPQVIERYPGGDIALPGDPARVIRCEDNPELDRLQGRTLITSDGTTLLGADDKAGVAMRMATPALSSAPSSVVPSLVIRVRPWRRSNSGLSSQRITRAGSPGRAMSPPG